MEILEVGASGCEAVVAFKNGEPVRARELCDEVYEFYARTNMLGMLVHDEVCSELDPARWPE
jgi:hypothetical protein